MFLPLLPCPLGFRQRLYAQAAKQLHHVREVKSRHSLAEKLGQPCLSSQASGSIAQQPERK